MVKFGSSPKTFFICHTECVQPYLLYRMKTKVFCQSIFALVFTLMCSLSLQAAAPKTYLYDTKEENGKIVSKVIFLQEDGLLNKQVKYEFAYNEAGKVSEKKAYRWNTSTDKWDPYYLISYQYEADGNIQTRYGMWNPKKKDFSLNIQQMTIPVSGYNEIFS